ncbi:MAG: matrixin family metalloprotease, partial [Campylobacteraceae bacterium]|nr:matrixin family metalloprotease [Campylobacteraceae bacterium]
DWIGVSCQGLGASVWWPCKDHQSDEPDSMRITCSAKYPNKIIANGNLRKDTAIWSNYLNCWLNQSKWFVSYPINNYDVSINIGDYVHFSDVYISGDDSLDLSYYVLSYNEEKAKEHFQQVKPMMQCFENYFGKYPFWNDGYALVETPYLGMEHQSAIAYGNDYLAGYHGNTNFIAGLDFDYIIVHESGHEWWGNSITTNDIADMWVQEGFCTYSEVLYVECMYGYETKLKYVNNQRNRIKNDNQRIKIKKKEFKKLQREFNKYINSYNRVLNKNNSLIYKHNRLHHKTTRMQKSFKEVKGISISNKEIQIKTYFKNGKKVKEKTVTYTTRKIEIYSFETLQELKAILAHEIIHLLGIQHINVKGALMNPILQHNQIKELKLTIEDIRIVKKEFNK